MLLCIVLIHLELRNVFQTVFFVSKRQHYTFLECVDWCHILLHKEDTGCKLGKHVTVRIEMTGCEGEFVVC